MRGWINESSDEQDLENRLSNIRPISAAIVEYLKEMLVSVESYLTQQKDRPSGERVFKEEVEEQRLAERLLSRAQKRPTPQEIGLVSRRVLGQLDVTEDTLKNPNLDPTIATQFREILRKITGSEDIEQNVHLTEACFALLNLASKLLLLTLPTSEDPKTKAAFRQISGENVVLQEVEVANRCIKDIVVDSLAVISQNIPQEIARLESTEA